MKRYRNTKYLVTEDGKVWSEYVNRFVKPGTNQGYKFVHIGKKKTMRVHRMVCECYIPNPNNYPEVNHINNDRSDNRVENLEWCTKQMNKDHSVKQKRHSLGTRHGNVKINEEDVRNIIKLYNSGMKQVDIAKIYNLYAGSIYAIVKRITWKHLKIEE